MFLFSAPDSSYTSLMAYFCAGEALCYSMDILCDSSAWFSHISAILSLSCSSGVWLNSVFSSSAIFWFVMFL
jgi:hypothetical protein